MLSPAPIQDCKTPPRDAAITSQTVIGGLLLAAASAVVTVELMALVRYQEQLDWSSAAYLAWFSFLVASAAALCIGLPGHLILAGRRRTSLWPYLVVGAIGGMAPVVFLVNVNWGESRESPA